MNTQHPFRPPARHLRRLRLFAWLAAGLLALCALPASAQSCWVNDGLDIAFGEVNGSGGDTSDTLTITCNRNVLQYVHFRVCMNIPQGAPIPGLNPRWMTNYNGAQMAYDLFADAGRTRQIGPAGGGYPVHGTTFALSSALVFQGSTNMQVYGRVRPGQSLPATHGFQSQINGGQIRYAYTTSIIGFPVAAPTEEACQASPLIVDFYTHVTARFANTCRITTATDLDFGTVATLPGNRDQTSTVQLQCPSGTAWRVGIGNGSHAQGAVRRMSGPAGNYLRYELYRDTQRTQRWGTASAESVTGSGNGNIQSLTVHGRVPAQPSPRAGSYSDTVTVTLTY